MWVQVTLPTDCFVDKKLKFVTHPPTHSYPHPPLAVVLADLDNKRSDRLFCLSFEKTKKNERLYLTKKQTWSSSMVLLNIMELFPDNNHLLIRTQTNNCYYSLVIEIKRWRNWWKSRIIKQTRPFLIFHCPWFELWIILRLLFLSTKEIYFYLTTFSLNMLLPTFFCFYQDFNYESAIGKTKLKNTHYSIMWPRKYLRI